MSLKRFYIYYILVVYSTNVVMDLINPTTFYILFFILPNHDTYN